MNMSTHFEAATGATTAVPPSAAVAFEVRVCDNWETLVNDLAHTVNREVPADPFSSLTLVVRGAAARRAISQAIALKTGASNLHGNTATGDGGICAGVEFVTISSLRARLDAEMLDRLDGSDPWRRRPLTLTILELMRRHADAEWFAPIRQHLEPAWRGSLTSATSSIASPSQGAAADLSLGRHSAGASVPLAAELPPRPGRWLATADRIASLFRTYLRDAPEMIRQWNDAAPAQALAPSGQPLPQRFAWQPILWALTRESLATVPDPVTRRAQLADRLRRAEDPSHPATLPPHLLLVDPGPLSLADHEWLEALATVRPVTLWMLATPGANLPWARRLGSGLRSGLERLIHDGATVRSISATSGDGPGSQTVLRRLQASLSGASGSPTGQLDTEGGHSEGDASDASVQVHASHGPDRQVEVLREVLCALFIDDPLLEPRDVVVLCPNLERFAPIVRAAFASGHDSSGGFDPGSPGEGVRHPATQLRVQVAASSLDDPNPALDLLETLLWLRSSRATAQDFLDLCASPLVAERFSFDSVQLDTLARMLQESHAHWGLDAQHRERFGVVRVRQSTWLASVERLLVSVAVGTQPAGWLGTVAPVEGIGSRDADVIGSAAEVLSRVRRLVSLWEQPATMPEWTSRLRDALDSLSLSSGAHASSLSFARAQLNELARLTDDSTATLGTADVRSQFTHMVRRARGRANHRNGSLLVTSLDDLHNVSHKVVVLLGVDEGTVPPPVRHDGDSVLAEQGDPETGSRARSLAAVVEAIRAASNTLVVIHQGFDPRTNEAVPTPPVVAELVDACRSVGGCQQRQHTLLAESISNFFDHTDAAGIGEVPISFDPVALRGAQAIENRLRGATPTPVSPAPLAPAAPDADLADLLAFLRNPAAALVRHRLGLSLASYDPELSAQLPLEADGLIRWRLGHDFVSAELDGHDLDDVERAAQLSGLLPPYPHANKALHQERDKALSLAQAVSERIDIPGSRRRKPTTEHRVRLDLSAEGAGVLTAQIRTIGVDVVQWRTGRVRFSHLLALWLELLVLRAHEPDSHWRGIMLGSGDEYTVRPPDAATARRFLAELARLRATGLSRVVPIPAKVLDALIPLDPAGPSRAHETRAREAWRQLSEQPEWHMTAPISFFELQRLAPEPGDPGVPMSRRLEQLCAWISTALLREIGVLPPPRGES